MDLPGGALWTGITVQTGQTDLYRYTVLHNPVFENMARLQVLMLEVPLYGTFARAFGTELSAGARVGLARLSFTQTGFTLIRSDSQPQLTGEIQRTESRIPLSVGARASVGLPLHLRADLDAGYRWLSVGLPLATAPTSTDGNPLIVPGTYLDLSGLQVGAGLRFVF